MAYTIEQFQKDVANEYLHYLTPEEILKQIPISEILKQFSTNEASKQLPKEEMIHLNKIIALLENADKNKSPTN